MDKRDWQKVRQGVKAYLKAIGKVPSPPTAQGQVDLAKKRLWRGRESESAVSDLPNPVLTPELRKLVRRQMLAGARWHRRGPRFCPLCSRLFLPTRREQIYHANACGSTVEYYKLHGFSRMLREIPIKTFIQASFLYALLVEVARFYLMVKNAREANVNRRLLDKHETLEQKIRGLEGRLESTGGLVGRHKLKMLCGKRNRLEHKMDKRGLTRDMW